jgi:hypothetical protein
MATVSHADSQPLAVSKQLESKFPEQFQYVLVKNYSYSFYLILVFCTQRIRVSQRAESAF